jgi:glycosyltransferase involved in cell wall biosynthesis
VIPAYNEARRLPGSLEQILAYLDRQPFSAEVIVVDDGSDDDTVAVVERFQTKHPDVRLIRNPHRGKGGAVQTGMLAAQGSYRFLCDADLSMPIRELAKFLPPALNGYDIAIGSREATGARRVAEPGYRHLMGRVFNWVVKVFAVHGFEDTQAGFKCFTAEAAQNVFARQTMDGFGFDVEVLFIAQKRGYDIVEVPIEWHYKASSRVDPVRDTMRMFRDVLRVRLNDLRGLYADRQEDDKRDSA